MATVVEVELTPCGPCRTDAMAVPPQEVHGSRPWAARRAGKRTPRTGRQRGERGVAGVSLGLDPESWTRVVDYAAVGSVAV
jgi:hypothetical protein